MISGPEYALLSTGPRRAPTHRRVQVLDRFRARAVCRVCAGEPMSDGGDCPVCGGSGKERQATEWAKVGYLDGDEAGTTAEVRAAALKPEAS